MSPQRWQQIQDVFDELVDLDEGHRSERLEEIGREDSALRKQVESLLEAYENADEILPSFGRTEGAAVAARSGIQQGTVLDNYEILGEIGRGGMGVVYRAPVFSGRIRTGASLFDSQ